ncbi:hypothetical protein EKH77_11820 [Streptomyces luteoverticillatus]|uniref:Uncharacterized protein n=1 Tax=Streptomyces luteoverticillatus TaxID=66425 RepID=A0A3Q9FVQ4_STRLT|nr:hypothetical protein [Streptomyces luteoverticillatus]AZQ71806.1 hypothetical protein EKH77_11820 [Streptomyces luteoverticillatus]
MSGGGGDGIQASQAALGNVAKGINAAIGELKGIGGAGAASVGRGFDDLALSGLELGHGGLTASLKNFCERWDWGVRALIQDADQFAERVGLAAGYYHERDRYVADTFKIVANAAMGNPHLTEDQVKEKSVSEVLSDNAFTQTRDADYSLGSFAKAGEGAKDAWSKTGKDLMDSAKTGGPGPLGVAVRTVSKIEDY